MKGVCHHCAGAIDRANPNYRKMKFCGIPCYRAYYASEAWGIAQFWSKVTKQEDGCWIYHGHKPGKDKFGHCDLSRNNRTIMAHRYSWEIHNGPIPEGLWVLHHCDVPACIRPEHLFLGTHQDNMRDASMKRRTTWGERNHTAILTAERVQRIRADYRRPSRNKSNAKELAAQHGVSRAAVLSIVAGRSWKHLT